MAKGIDVFTELNGFVETSQWLENKMIASDVVYLVGTNTEYSIYVEFGTSKMSAQPYMIPAANKAFAEAKSIWNKVGYDLRALIAELAYRIEKYAKEFCPVDTGNLRASIEVTRLE